MFDSHCHLHDARVVDAAGALARARAVGVHGFLLAGVDAAGGAGEAALCRAHDDVAQAIGIHPEVVAALDDDGLDRQLSALENALTAGATRLWAVGEIGLDAVGDHRASLARQERAFRAQLGLARRFRLPVALHVRDAHPRALVVLEEEGAGTGVLHSCSASAELVRDYLALGFHLSFAGAVTRPTARKVHAAARAVPRERLLVETDAPDQTPERHRGGPNEPAFLPAIVDALAALRGESSADVARFTDDNARRLLAR